MLDISNIFIKVFVISVNEGLSLTGEWKRLSLSTTIIQKDKLFVYVYKFCFAALTCFATVSLFCLTKKIWPVIAINKRTLAWKPAREFCTGRLEKKRFSELLTASLYDGVLSSCASSNSSTLVGDREVTDFFGSKTNDGFSSWNDSKQNEN